MDLTHNVPHTPVFAPNPNRVRFEEKLLKVNDVRLDADQRRVVLAAIKQHSAFRHWKLYAAHVRSNHVHVVVWAATTPEDVMSQLKRYASRALNLSENRPSRRWARHGSTRYLWNVKHVAAAVDYVENEQGKPMALFVYANRD